MVITLDYECFEFSHENDENDEKLLFESAKARMVDFGYIAIAGNSRKYGYYLTEKGLALFNKDLATDLKQALSNSIDNKELKLV